MQERAVGREERYGQLERLQFFVNEVLKGRRNSKLVFYSVIRSFYAHNRVELPRDPGFRVKADREPVVGELTRDGLRALLLKADRKYRAVFTIMFMGFMGYREFNVFNRSDDVREKVLSGADLIKVRMPGRKRGKPFYTFVAGDALKALRDYLDHDRGPVRPSEALIVNRFGNPLTQGNVQTAFLRIAEAAGIVEKKTPPCPKCGGKTRKIWKRRPDLDVTYSKLHYLCRRCGHLAPAGGDMRISSSVRYGVNPHELRDTAKSTWYRASPEKWLADFFMGHDVDPNHYNKAMKIFPDWVEDCYREALPWLNILSEDPEKVPRRQYDALRRDFEKAAQLLERVGWLAEDPEMQQILRNIVEERRKRGY